MYKVEAGYQAALPYHEAPVAPCKVWFSFVDGLPPLQELGRVSEVVVLDSGLGVAPGALAIGEEENPGGPFSASFDVCELRTQTSAAGKTTGRHFEVCNVAIGGAGRFFIDGMERAFSGGGGTPTIPGRARLLVEKSFEEEACGSAWGACRPAVRVNASSAGEFKTSLNETFPGLIKGHRYAFAVVPKYQTGSNTSWGGLPRFDADIAGTSHTGDWVTVTALGFASAQGLVGGSCAVGTYNLAWEVADYGALNDVERTRQKLQPSGYEGAALEAAGGREVVRRFIVELQLRNASNAGAEGAEEECSPEGGNASAPCERFTFSLSEKDTASGPAGRYATTLTSLTPGGYIRSRVRIETPAGLGAWSPLTPSLSTPSASPEVRVVEAKVEEGREGLSLVVDWRLRCGPDGPDDLTTPVNGLTSAPQTPADADAAQDFRGCEADGGLLLKVNTMTLLRASPTSDCSMGDIDPRSDPRPAGVTRYCCNRWAVTPSVACGTSSRGEPAPRVCIWGTVTLRDVEGVAVEAGGRFNVTVQALTPGGHARGSGVEQFVDVQVGTARDMHGRLAAHCTTPAAGKRWCYSARAGPLVGYLQDFGAAPPVEDDECLRGTHDCGRDPNGVCSNTEGSFMCACAAGWRSVELSGVWRCVDQDECSHGGGACGMAINGSECVNTPGSFTCVCPSSSYLSPSSPYGLNGTEPNKSNATCVPCGLSFTSPQNSSSRDACACEVGYRESCLNDDGGREQNASLCSLALLDADEAVLRAVRCDDVDECLEEGSSCAPEGGGVCTNTNGSFLCSCAEDFYGDGLACHACVDNSTAEAGSRREEDCTCAVGSRKRYLACSGPACVPSCGSCPEGMYTNSSSDWTPNCTMCPVGTAKPAGTGDACTACPENAEAVTLGMGMCLCVAGYAGDPNTLEPPFCTECGFGFYNPGSANTPCSACPAGTNTTSSNASESVCDCDCLEGYVGAACGACAICEAGTFKETATHCALCPADTFAEKEEGALSCTPCPDNSSAVEGSYTPSSCLCNEGYEGVNGSSPLEASCAPCLPGWAKNGSGPGACAMCGNNTYSDAGADCLPCAANASSPGASPDEGSCACPPGSFINRTAGACAVCPTGRYCEDGREATLCVADTYSDEVGAEDNATCVECDAGLVAPPGSANCSEPVTATS